IETLSLWSLAAESHHVGIGQSQNIEDASSDPLTIGVFGESGIPNVDVSSIDASRSKIDSNHIAAGLLAHPHQEATDAASNVENMSFGKVWTDRGSSKLKG